MIADIIADYIAMILLQTYDATLSKIWSGVIQRFCDISLFGLDYPNGTPTRLRKLNSNQLQNSTGEIQSGGSSGGEERAR